MFEDVDLDSNGVISRSELFKNLKKYLSGAHKFVNDYLHRLDADEDGVVSFRELLETLYPGKSKKIQSFIHFMILIEWTGAFLLSPLPLLFS